ncbi:balbiani ring protein 3 [Bicyclus anynana]|uniref:Balbiani ring protein 3 n=1 Tax=Bicyclus anynana TaxID=110368 RepID=A0A6J1MYF6_BICAN|nr:balbiani ring protein 3 [Bicyclus anynana]
MACYRFVVTILVSTSLLITSTEAQCGPNEVERKETDNKSDSCPVPEGQPPNSPANSESNCVCGLLFKRAANGTCIPSRECPPIPCGENEEFDSCPVCSEDCSNKSPDGKRCRFFGKIGITVICQPACRCIANYWRDQYNKCVPFNKCPLCGPNEVEKKETDDESDSCPVPEGQPPNSPVNSESNCVCGPLFKRAANGTCIPSRECPPIPCGENEEFDSCPVCSEDCSNKSPDGKRCRFLGKIGTTVICQPACRCIANYWRDQYNKCVPFNKCPQCGPNEVERKESGDKSDSCPVPEGQPPNSPVNSESNCVCGLMYKRAANGTCIPSRQCPPIPCGENEKFDSCPEVCSDDCSNKSPDGRRCRFIGNALFTVICQPACRCIDYYWRDDCGNCIPYDECPQTSEE